MEKLYDIEYDLNGYHKQETGLTDYDAILRQEELEIIGAENIEIIER